MTRRPTILLITADELHCGALSAYGATSHETVHLDRLAGGGMLFEAAYTASPHCLPSRCSIMTGLYPHRHLSMSNNTGRSLSRTLPNLYSLLSARGYRTSLHGKCHFVPVPYAYTAREYTREYEHFLLYYRSLGIGHLDLMDDPQVSAWFYDDYAKELERQGLLRGFRDCVWDCRVRSERYPTPGVFAFPGPDDLTPDSWVGEKTLEYIRGYEEEAPAFIWASFGGPHYPTCAPLEYYDRIRMEMDRPRAGRVGEWQDGSRYHSQADGWGNADGDLYAPERNQRLFDEAYWRAWRHGYYASVLQIDDYVGRIVAAAEEKWGTDLLIVFTADHGDMMGDHGFWGKTLHDPGVRVPLIVRWPGEKAVGERSDAMVQLVDLLPTFCVEAGVEEVPEMDGRDLREWVERGGRPVVLSESEAAVMLRSGDCKYIRRKRPDGVVCEEVYDLVADPEETENRWKELGSVDGAGRLVEAVERLEREEGMLRNLFYVPGVSDPPPPWAAL